PPRDPQPAGGPPGGGGEEVPVGGARVAGGGQGAAAAQDVLVGHELAVVLAGGALERLESGVGQVRAGGPLPPAADGALGGGSRVAAVGVEFVPDVPAGGRDLPFELGGQPGTGPARIGVCLVEGHVDHGLGVHPGATSREGEGGPLTVGPVGAPPVAGRLPPLGLHGGPAVGEPQFGAGVAVVGHEALPVAHGHLPGGDLPSGDPHGVPGAFVVVGEPVVVGADVGLPLDDDEPVRLPRRPVCG